MRSPSTTLPNLTIYLAALALALTGLVAIHAQEGEDDAADQPEIFIDQIDVNLVNVEVYVTDSKGSRINDLTSDDFEIYEDGRPVKISNFYSVVNGRRLDDPRPVATLPMPEAPEISEPARPALSPQQLRENPELVPQEQRLHLVLYFDNLFLKPFSRNRVVRGVRQFLRENISPGDSVMLATFDRTYHIRVPFTTDIRAINEELFEIETLSGFAEQAETERRDILRRIEGSGGVHEAQAHVDLYAQSLYHDVTTTVRVLKEMVGSLAGLPGRKAILHVSDGIPMTPAEDLYYMLDFRYGDDSFGALEARRYNTRRNFQDLTAHANANRVTFYTLEARGLRSHTSLSAEYGGSIGTDGLVSGSRIDVDMVRLSGHQETLQLMALETGGLATFNTNNIFGAFDRMSEDFRSYYSLGYFPAHSGDGRYHDIEVKVKRKGAKVRHRTGYRDKSPEVQLSEVTLAALLYGVESNPMEIELRFSAEKAEDDNQYLLPIEVRIPIGNATLIPQTEVHHGKLLVSVAVIDEDGRMSPVQQAQIPLTIPNQEVEVAKKSYFVYSAELIMRRGRQRVAVGVRDELAAQASYIRRPIRVGT